VSDFEHRLRFALAPVEPPARLTDRFERALSEIADAAAEELADWELRSMRDPRNWMRPAAAAVAAGVAGGALVVVQARQRQRRSSQRRRRSLEHGLRRAADEARRRVGG
jgi:hypothetical protein